LIYISKPHITEAEKSAVIEVLNSGMLAQGKKTAELEERFAAVCETRHAVATSSGTTGLYLTLLAHGIGEGDEVITTSFTFIASTSSVLFTGARPVFVDIEEETFNIDPKKIEAVITPKTKAILPVHLYGHPCDMETIMAIAERHGLQVIEDAAQAVGAKYRGKPVGGFGTGVFSLYATKNVMSGEGGMITTDDDQLAEHLRMLRSHGMKERYYHEMLGYNFRTSDLHAAIGVEQIKRIDELTEKRRKNAAYLNEHLEGVITPTARPEVEHVWHQYTIRVPGDRDRAIEHLHESGVGTGIFYPVPVHKQGYIQELVGEVSLPVTERLAEEVISLPVHPSLTQQDLETIVEAVNSI